MNRLFARSPVGALAVALLCASCSSGMQMTPLAPGVSGMTEQSLGLQTTHRKGVLFVISLIGSPAASLDLSISRVGGLAPVAQKTIDLTSKSPGCTKTACSAAFDLPAWDYAATIAAYVKVNKGGKMLSSGQVVPFSIGASATTVNLTLSAALAHVDVEPGGLGESVSKDATFTIDGVRPRPLVVVALDAAKGIIVGPDAPALAATIDGAGWHVTKPAKDAPNTLPVTAPAKKGASATLHVSATQGKHKAETEVKFVNHLQSLMAFEGSLGTVIFAPPYNGMPQTNTNGTCGEPLSAAFDGSSNLYVSAGCQSAGSEEIVKYAPPYTGAPTATMGQGTLGPPSESALCTVNATGDAFAAPLESFDYDVAEFKPPYTAPPVTIGTGTVYPTAYAINAKDDLFVQSSGAGSNGPSVVEFAPPYTAPAIQTITAGMPRGSAIALDPAGNLFVFGSGSTGYVVAEYAPPYKGGPVTEITNGVEPTVTSMALDGAGNLFVFYQNEAMVDIYSAPYKSAPIVVSVSGNTLTHMALDLAGDLYLGHYYTTGPAQATITAIAPPYKGAAYQTITKGLQYATNAYGPTWITLTP
jgi:hypothetical protein